MQVEKKLEVSKAQCLMDEPFFATLLIRMPLKERNDIPTFATDGWFIYYNREFVETLSLDDTKFILLHEVLHPAFFHCTRRGHRDASLWNIAGD